MEPENHWMDLTESWYVCYATGVYPKIVLLNFLQFIIPIQQMNKPVR
jgi:hypothetical protein